MLLARSSVMGLLMNTTFCMICGHRKQEESGVGPRGSLLTVYFQHNVDAGDTSITPFTVCCCLCYAIYGVMCLMLG